MLKITTDTDWEYIEQENLDNSIYSEKQKKCWHSPSCLENGKILFFIRKNFLSEIELTDLMIEIGESLLSAGIAVSGKRSYIHQDRTLGGQYQTVMMFYSKDVFDALFVHFWITQTLVSPRNKKISLEIFNGNPGRGGRKITTYTRWKTDFETMFAQIFVRPSPPKFNKKSLRDFLIMNPQVTDVDFATILLMNDFSPVFVGWLLPGVYNDELEFSWDFPSTHPARRIHLPFFIRHRDFTSSFCESKDRVRSLNLELPSGFRL